MAPKAIIETIRRYVALLNTEGLSVKKAFLFGSYANGDATDQSDIDVMIVSDSYDENSDIAAGKMWRLTRSVNIRIEPFLIGTDKFKNDNTSPLLSMIKREGLEIEIEKGTERSE
jgi:predicted nucleotidyltransferase